MSKGYGERLLDPRWQKLRLEVLSRCKWKCVDCDDAKSTLHVHHAYYVKGRDPWDYPPMSLTALCKNCHEDRHAQSGAGPEYWMPFEQVFELAARIKEPDADANCHAAEPLSAALLRIDDVPSITDWNLMNSGIVFGRAVEAVAHGVDARALADAFDEMLRDRFGFSRDRALAKYEQWKAGHAKERDAESNRS